VKSALSAEKTDIINTDKNFCINKVGLFSSSTQSLLSQYGRKSQSCSSVTFDMNRSVTIVVVNKL